jgi:hypothetical protein
VQSVGPDHDVEAPRRSAREVHQGIRLTVFDPRHRLVEDGRGAALDRAVQDRRQVAARQAGEAALGGIAEHLDVESADPPAPQKSMRYPPVRSRGARSISVGCNP